MTFVSGPIKLVTDRPSAVTQVLVGAPALRLHGAGIVLDHPDGIPVVGGVVEFEALPGPATLTMVSVGGAPMESVEIVVPDSETATLSECLEPVYVYAPPVVNRGLELIEGARDEALGQVSGAIAAEIDARASITWSYEGTGTPAISSYHGIKVGDYIVRKSDGQEWRVDA